MWQSLRCFLSLGIYVELYIPKTNIISFTLKNGKVTQLTATVVQKYATVILLYTKAP